MNSPALVFFDAIDIQDRYLQDLSTLPNPRKFPDASTPSAECYADKDMLPVEVQRLKSAFSNMSLRANAKVTSERVFSMVVHPEPTKTVVLVGDKYGQLGM